MLLQILIAQTEMMIAKETAIGRQWRWVCRTQNAMFRCVNELCLALRITAPQDEHHMLPFGTDQTNDGIGELFPTTLLMAGCHVGSHGQGGVQEQDTLFCPSRQIARLGNRFAKVCLNLLEDVAERRGKRHTIIHRKAQTMCLLGLMIGVLSYQHHLHLRQRTKIERVENEFARRIASALGIFSLDKLNQLLKIRILLTRKNLKRTRKYLLSIKILLMRKNLKSFRKIILKLRSMKKTLKKYLKSHRF